MILIDNNNIRQSNFELMRILSIILILINHYVVFGLGKMNLPCSAFYTIFSHFIACFAKVGVMLFIMITGYFMIDKTRISVKHIIKIIIDTVFYSWFFLLLFTLVFPNYKVFTPYEIYKSILPISSGWLWFISTYLMLYLFIPIINYVFNFLSLHKIKFYLFLFCILWYIIPTFFYKVHLNWSHFVGFIYLYCLGAFIKKYRISFFESTRNRLIVVIISCISFICYLYACNYFKLSDFKYWLHLGSEQSIFSLLIAISFFHYFKNLKLVYNQFINYLASVVLSVYIIHVNLRVELFTKIFQCCKYANVPYLIINIVSMILGVYIFCIIIDKLKNKLFCNKLNNFIANSKFVKSIDNIYIN